MEGGQKDGTIDWNVWLLTGKYEKPFGFSYSAEAQTETRLIKTLILKRTDKVWRKKKDLSAAEKCEIVECLGQVMKTLDISQTLKRDHCAVKRFVAESQHTWVHAHKQKRLQWA